MNKDEIISAIRAKNNEIDNLRARSIEIKDEIEQLKAQFESPYKPGDVVCWDYVHGYGKSSQLRTKTVRVREVAFSDNGELSALRGRLIKKDGTEGDPHTICRWDMTNPKSNFRKADTATEVTANA